MQRLLYPVVLICAALSLASCAEDKYYESSAYPVNNSPSTVARSNFQVPLNLTGLATIGKGNVKLNPEHGKPGHQCSIPVGAPLDPLNSVPAAQGNAAMQKILSVPIQPSFEPIPTEGPNPAHGKPGHRCDIAVGAPLNSKAPSPTPTPTPVPQVQQPEVATAPGMNPSHGKPGHRCDIAVGAPLPGK